MVYSFSFRDPFGIPSQASNAALLPLYSALNLLPPQGIWFPGSRQDLVVATVQQLNQLLQFYGVNWPPGAGKVVKLRLVSETLGGNGLL